MKKQTKITKKKRKNNIKKNIITVAAFVKFFRTSFTAPGLSHGSIYLKKNTIIYRFMRDASGTCNLAAPPPQICNLYNLNGYAIQGYNF